MAKMRAWVADERHKGGSVDRMTEALGCLLAPGESAHRATSFAAGATRRTYAVVPGTRDGILVPLTPAACAAAGVSAHSAASGVRARWGVRVLTTLARTGATRFAPKQYVLGDAEGTLLGHLEELLGEDLHAAIHLGPPRANRKPVLHLMDRRGGTVAFVKVGVDALTDARVRAETHALERMAADRPTGLVIPAVLAAGMWQGHAYAVLEPVPTGPGPTDVPIDTAHRIAASLPSPRLSPVREKWWLEAIELLRAGPDSEIMCRLRCAAEALETNAPEQGVPSGPTHGDFTPWNCFAGPRGVSVWDWERFATDRPIGWDALHYAVSLALRDRSTRAELRAVRRRADELTEANGGERGSGAWVYAAYLWYRGVSAVRDGQSAAGSPGGALDQWLLPELEALLAEDLAARP